MKRRTFLQRTSIGLPALAAGMTGAGGLLRAGDGKRRVYGIPDSVRPRTPLEHNLARLSLARTDLPPEAWQDVMALSLLAQDVFDRPEVAAAFTRDPRGYLAAVGMQDVELDPAAIETRIALALGDPEIRRAVEKDDPREFLQALEDRDLLRRPEPSQLAATLSAQMETLRAGAQPGAATEGCTAVVICVALALAVVWVWIGVVQDVVAVTTATAAVSVYAYVLIYVRVVGPKPLPPGEDALGRTPPFRLAGALGGQQFRDRALSAFVDENVETIASAVEGLRIYREHAPMSGEELRRLVRAQTLRLLSGHAVSLPAPRP